MEPTISLHFPSSISVPAEPRTLPRVPAQCHPRLHNACVLFAILNKHAITLEEQEAKVFCLLMTFHTIKAYIIPPLQSM